MYTSKYPVLCIAAVEMCHACIAFGDPALEDIGVGGEVEVEVDAMEGAMYNQTGQLKLFEQPKSPTLPTMMTGSKLNAQQPAAKASNLGACDVEHMEAMPLPPPPLTSPLPPPLPLSPQPSPAAPIPAHASSARSPPLSPPILLPPMSPQLSPKTPVPVVHTVMRTSVDVVGEDYDVTDSIWIVEVQEIVVSLPKGKLVLKWTWF